MERILYIDCFSGISGDMLLGAFLDLGFPEELLRQTLKPFGLDQTFKLIINKTSRHKIAALKIDFPEITDHGMGLPHTHFREICQAIESAPLKQEIKKLGLDIFRQLAIAESKVHQVDIDKVHFHEVGGIDSIADIMGIAAALHWCDAGRIIAPAVPLGTGFIHCQHGELPLPVPAVSELLREIPVIHTGIPAELVTPTGAAVLKTIVTEFQPQGYRSPWIVETTGYGAGSRDLAQRPNLLRLQLGHKVITESDSISAGYPLETICLLETAIDDMTPEQVGALQEELLAAGAVDVIIHQVLMKKNRPGYVIQLVVPVENEIKMVDHLFLHSSTLGIRRGNVSRYLLERTIEKIDTPLGPVRLKIARNRRKIILNIKPEYEDVLTLAKKHHLSLSQVEQNIMAHYRFVSNHGS
ncbi:MAG: nickel pincer cofactor biosynthesis protein LarC [Pseudomonadota bacterium]|nr:nickel pincer cofactor biosynthesis protein LarC [Pseudomonadota bacterium]